MSSVKQGSPSRRRFLRAVGSASTVAVAATTAPLLTIDEAKAYDPGKQERRTRYQPDSADVQAFYRTNRYETLKK